MEKTIAIFALLLLLLLLCSCAHAPGEKLLNGLEHDTQTSDIDINIVTGLGKATYFCNKYLLNQGKYGIFTLNIALNFGVFFGCSLVEWDANGDVQKCTIYRVADWDWITDHEMRHCKGYADQSY